MLVSTLDDVCRGHTEMLVLMVLQIFTLVKVGYVKTGKLLNAFNLH